MSSFIQQWVRALNEHEIEKLRSLYDENAGSVVVSENYSFNDLQSLVDMARRFFNAFPDLRFEVLQEVEKGDHVAVLWVAKGTHRGKYNNIPPTGKMLEVQGTFFFTLKSRKIIKTTFLWDGADMLRQMGLLPDVQVAA